MHGVCANPITVICSVTHTITNPITKIEVAHTVGQCLKTCQAKMHLSALFLYSLWLKRFSCTNFTQITNSLVASVTFVGFMSNLEDHPAVPWEIFPPFE